VLPSSCVAWILVLVCLSGSLQVAVPFRKCRLLSSRCRLLMATLPYRRSGLFVRGGVSHICVGISVSMLEYLTRAWQ